MNDIIGNLYKLFEKTQINSHDYIINHIQVTTAWIFLRLFSHQIDHTTYLLLQLYNK